MQHLNPYRFYELASKLHALFDGALVPRRVTEMFAPLTEAQNILDGWIKGNFFALESSKDAAVKLLGKVSALFAKYYIDPSSRQLKTPVGEDRIDAHETAMFYGLLEKFEHALAAELTHAPVYAAEKRGIYSTYDLIENARRCFSKPLRAAMPVAALDEFDRAGRALAFGLGTASVMHLLRATETVLRRYYEVFSNAPVARTERAYGIYLKKLMALSDEEDNEDRPDKRLLQMLDQIREIYRAPLLDAERSMSIDQATALFALSMAAMTMMGERLVSGARRGGDVSSGPSADGGGSGAIGRIAPSVLSDVGGEDDGGENYDFRASKAG